MSDAFPRVGEVFPGVPSQPRTSNVAAEKAVAIGNQRRAEQAVFDQQARDRGSVFRSVASILGTGFRYLQEAQNAGGAQRRERAQTDFVFKSYALRNEIAKAEDPEKAFADWWEQTERLQHQAQTTIQNPEHESQFVSFAENWKRQQLPGAMQEMGARTVEMGRQGMLDNVNRAIEAGDPEMVYEIVGAARSDGFIDAAGAERVLAGGVNAAAMEQVNRAAQVIYDEHGLDAAVDWIRDPDNHDPRYRLDIDDLDNIADTLEEQAVTDMRRMEMQRGEDMAEFILWSIPVMEGNEPITLAALTAKVNEMLPNHSSLQRAEIIRDTYGKTTSGRSGTGTAAEAARRRDVIVSLEKASRGLTSENAGHFLELVNRHFRNGDFGEGREAVAEYRRWLSVLEKDAGDVQRIAEPGEAMIDSLMHLMRMSNVAAERQLKDPFIGEKGLYREEGDRQALLLEPGEGDLLDVYNAQGELTVRSFTEIGDELKADLRAMIKRAPGDVDVAVAAKQLLHRALVAMKPGVQEMEWVGESGAPAPAEWTIAEVPVGKRRRQRFPDVEAIDAGIAFLGEHGLAARQLTIGTRPLGDGRTGAHALQYLDSRSDLAPPLYAAANLEWQGLMDEGLYIQAAEIAADALPRTAAGMAEVRRAGGIWDFTDNGDGSFSVQFVQGGVTYPVFPIEEGDEAALAAMLYPDSSDLLSQPRGRALSPGGAVPTPRGGAGAPAPAPAPAPPVPLSSRVTEIDTEIADLTSQWNQLGAEYLSVNDQINAAPEGSVIVSGGADVAAPEVRLDPATGLPGSRYIETTGLMDQQAALASKRREVGARITALRQRKQELLAEEMESLRHMDSLNSKVLEEIMLHYGGY